MNWYGFHRQHLPMNCSHYTYARLWPKTAAWQKENLRWINKQIRLGNNRRLLASYEFFIAIMAWPFLFDKILFNSIKLDEQFVRAAAAIQHLFVCVCECMLHVCLYSENYSHTKSACDSWESIAKFIHVEQTQILVFTFDAKKGASGGEHRKVKL